MKGAGLDRLSQNPFVELQLVAEDGMLEKFDDVTKTEIEVDEKEKKGKALVKIFGREAGEHERRNFDVKFEYGFREKAKT